MDWLHLVELVAVGATSAWGALQKRKTELAHAAKREAEALAKKAFEESMDQLAEAARRASDSMAESLAGKFPGIDLERLAMAREAALARGKALARQAYEEKMAPKPSARAVTKPERVVPPGVPL